MSLDPKNAPELRLTTLAEVTGAWATTDPEVASAVGDFHVGTDSFLDNRLKWRKGQALTVVEIRAYRLSRPVIVIPGPSHFGCFSWGERRTNDHPPCFFNPPASVFLFYAVNDPRGSLLHAICS